MAGIEEKKQPWKEEKWDPKTKSMIVLQGLKDKPIAELCSEHQINQAQYYQ